MSREVIEDYDTNGFLSYAYSKKVEDRYKLFSGTMNVTVADSEFSEFVITYFDKESTKDSFFQ
ncbi:MAG: hypothetical protein Q4F05_09840 [bacterium]|nr:hypothetical protein [bacterium]